MARQAITFKDPAKVAAGRKGGSAPHKGNKGFAADPKKAQEAGRKGAKAGWFKKRKAQKPTGPSELSKVKLEFEDLPGTPKPRRKRKTTK